MSPRAPGLAAPPAEPQLVQPVSDPRRELAPHLPRESRSEARNAEIRAALRPYTPGERPRIVLASTALSAAIALVNFFCWVAGVQIEGRSPGAVGIILFTAVLLACAIGLWQMRAGAVLGFMSLMAIIAILFTLFLIEASNILGAVVALAIIIVSGYLFFKLVRVLSRLQMPREDIG
jgi:hypothetical protein